MNPSINDLFKNPGQHENNQITVLGWVRTTRFSNAIGFIELNDGTCFKNLQIVAQPDIIAGFENASKLSISSAISVTGTFMMTPGSKQPFELQAIDIQLLADCDSDYPLQKKRQSFEFLREIAHLRPRTSSFSSIFRLRSVLSYATHTFFMQKGFVYVHSPIITSNDSEGAGDIFRVTTAEPGNNDLSQDFFGKEAFLTVSGQLQAEAFALAFKNTYTFGPTFRAENSNTARHAAEFWMVEPEIAFADLDDDMALAQELIVWLIKAALKELPDEMEFFNSFIDKTLLDRLEAVANSNFERMTYTKAIEVLQKSGAKFEYAPVWGTDLQTEHERFLAEEYIKGPLFVTDYPKDIKAFYMRANEDGKTVAAMDLLVPGVGEIIGGSQREERLDLLTARMDEMGIDREQLDWYLQLRKYGGVKHAGFGLGFERALMYISGMKNIRDVLPFPRTANNCKY
ncbi:MAG: asparagine--tRNA ligase [Eubacteriaceae bacterium]|nr:asparagine--tRNA ligase [Eubacteriaceae bacterium]